MQTTAILRVLGLLLLTEGCTSRTSSDEIAQVKAKTNVVTPKQKVAPKEKATSNFDSQQTNSIPAVGTQYILGDGPSGIELVELTRKDECCGFGGLFSIGEEAVSVSMGRDRLDDHLGAKAEVITSVDMSCLMHLDGIIQREKRAVRVLHIAELLREAISK